MRQKIKSLSITLMAFLCMFALTACGSSSTSEAEVVDPTITASLEATADELLATISSMSDEEIDGYIENGNAFTVSAMTSWQGSREELGAYQQINSAEVNLNDELYVLTADAGFEQMEATVTMNFDESGTPTYMTMEPKYGMGKLIERAGLNTLMGVCIVFCMLLLLSFIIALFKSIGKVGNKQKESAPAAAPVAAPVTKAVEEELVDDGELVAVIAAAIAASENTSTDSFVVRSIKRKINNKWQRA